MQRILRHAERLAPALRYRLPWCLVFLVAVATGAWEAVHTWPAVVFFPFNGHWQNHWPLYRLSAGEVPFLDFPAYLGAASTYLAWPLFVLLGGDLRASAVAFDALSAFVLVLSSVMACRLAGFRWITTAPLAAAICFFFWVLVQGSSSALGIRAFAPCVAATAVWWALRPGKNVSPGRVRAALLGAAAGSLVVWSNDYGIPSALAALIAFWFFAGVHAGVWAAAASPAGAFLAATAVSQGNPLAWLRSSVLDTAGMQAWYFFPDPSTKVFGPLDLPWWDPALWAAAAVAVRLVWISVARPQGRERARDAALLCLILGAAGGYLLSCFAGSYHLRYGIPFYQKVGPAAMALFAALAWRAFPQFVSALPSRAAAPLAAAVALAAMAWSLPGPLTSPERPRSILSQSGAGPVPELARGGGTVFLPEVAEAAELGRRLGARWDAEGVPPERRLLSLYASVLTATSGSRQPAPDYVIHALSDRDQDRFAQRVRDQEHRAVEALNPLLIVFGAWNVRMAWPLYRELFERWRPVKATAYSVIWEPAPHGFTAPERPSAACSVSASGDSVQVQLLGEQPVNGEDGRWWVDVSVDGDTRFRHTAFPFAGSLSFLLLADETFRGPGDTPRQIPNVGGWAFTRRMEPKVAFPVLAGWGESGTARVALSAHPSGRAFFAARSCVATAVAPFAATQPSRAPVPEGGVVATRMPFGPWPLRDGREAVAYGFLNPYHGFFFQRGDLVRIGEEAAEVVSTDFGFLSVVRPLGDPAVRDALSSSGGVVRMIAPADDPFHPSRSGAARHRAQDGYGAFETPNLPPG